MRAPESIGLATLALELQGALDLPLPRRADVLREIVDDAEGLYSELRRRGWSECAAKARVREVVIPDAAAREELHALHRGCYQRFAHRFTPARMQRWERVLLAVIVGATILSSAAALRRVMWLQEPAPLLGPVIGCGGVGLVLAIVKCLDLFVKGVHTSDGLRMGLAPLLGIALFTVLLSATGVSLDLYRLAATMESSYDPSGRLVLAFIRADGSLLAVGLTLALTVALAWFLLLQRVAVLEAADRDSAEVLGRLSGVGALASSSPELSDPLEGGCSP